jgi:hypothetical protein
MCTEKIFEEYNTFNAQIGWLRKNAPIYPKISLKHTDTEEIIASTIVRKEHKGKWFRQLIVQRSIIPIGGNAEELIERLISEVYKCLIFGKVDPKILRIDGSSLFELDTDQRSEAERLMSNINPQK